MGDALLLPAVLEVTTAAWAVTVGLILALLGFDLLWSGRTPSASARP